MLTTEKFIQRAREKFGDKFDYSEVNCKGGDTIVIIKCPRHGTFEIKAQHFLKSKYGCPKCSYNILTTDEFIKKAQEKHSNKYDYSKTVYNGSHNKVKIICPIHGEFEMVAKNHLNGCGCFKCKGNKMWDTIGRITTEDFVKKCKKSAPEYDYSLVEYTKSNKKVKIICPIHGEFEITPNSFQRGGRCPKCRKRFMNTDYFIECAKKVHGDKYNYSSVNYKNNTTNVSIICPEHGSFLQSPKVHLRGGGCPSCKMSHLENEVAQFLKKNNITYEYESHLYGLLKRQMVDFLIPNINLIIECQGGQHFYGGFNRNNPEKAQEIHHKVLERDIRKKKICDKYNIKVLYYTNIPDLPEDIFENPKYRNIYNKSNFFTNIDALINEIKG